MSWVGSWVCRSSRRPHPGARRPTTQRVQSTRNPSALVSSASCEVSSVSSRPNCDIQYPSGDGDHRGLRGEYNPGMRRLLRILLNAATVVSLLLCVATLLLWVRSYRTGDSLSHRATGPYLGSDFVLAG